MKYSKTEAGQQAFKQRSPTISARQRSMFILFDGQRTAAEVLAATSGMGATMDDVDSLVAQGYLVAAGGSVSQAAQPVPAAPPSAVAPALHGHTDQERYLEGKALATQVTARLGLRGFRLNLSVEAAANLKELIELLPKIQAAAGPEHCKELEAALRG